MEVQSEETTAGGVFYVEGDGKRLAEMTFVRTGGAGIIIDHTEVSSTLKGLGVGKQLLQAGVEYARAHQLKVMPLCPFAKAIFEKTPDYQDVLLS